MIRRESKCSIHSVMIREVAVLAFVAVISLANVVPNILSLSCDCLPRASCFSNEKFGQALDESVKIVLKGCDNVQARDVRELRLSFVRGGFSRSLSDFKNLEELILSHSLLNNFSSDLLAGLNALTKVSLDGNEIDELEEFKSVENVRKLFLANNKIKVVREKTFTNLQSLTLLTLEQNKIFFIHAKAFANNEKLLELNLNRNSLRALDSETFKGNKNLLELSMNHNLLTELSNEIFNGNFKLEVLRLHGNKLRSLNRALLAHNQNLRWIELGENELEFIDPLVFENVHQLEFIDLMGNHCVDESFPLNMDIKHLTELTKRNCHFLANIYFEHFTTDL